MNRLFRLLLGGLLMVVGLRLLVDFIEPVVPLLIVMVLMALVVGLMFTGPRLRQ